MFRPFRPSSSKLPDLSSEIVNIGRRRRIIEEKEVLSNTENLIKVINDGNMM
jgi:hypothetical protein